MRIAFFGDGRWAENSLVRLIEEGHVVVAVVLRTKPTDEALRELADGLGLTVHQPADVNESAFVAAIRSLAPDLDVSVSYDQILRNDILATARLGFVNCHAGMLPRYRGRSVVNWAIINGEEEIGLTVHLVDEGIDTGPIVYQESAPIAWEDTYAEVQAIVEQRLPEALVEAVRRLDAGTAKPRPQPELGTYFAARRDGDEWIDWRQASAAVYNKIRGITRPGPGARTLLAGRTLTLWAATYDRSWPVYVATPGEVVGVVQGEGVLVKTGDSVVLLRSVQYADEPEAFVPSFRRGTRLKSPADPALARLEERVARLEADLRARPSDG